MRISQILGRITCLPLDWLVVRGVDMTAQFMQLLQRITVFLLWFLILFVANFWFTFVLRRFPLSEPWGDALAANLLQLLRNLGRSAINAVPGVLTVIVSLHHLFDHPDSEDVWHYRALSGRRSPSHCFLGVDSTGRRNRLVKSFSGCLVV